VIASRLLPFSLIGFSALFAGCGGEGLTLPPEGQPAKIEVLTPVDDLSGQVTGQLPVLVKVTDSRGDPVTGASVAFSFADAAAGSADPATATTTGEGQASTTLILGPVQGRYMATAVVAEGVSVEFMVTALPAGANTIRISSGDPQTGTVNSLLQHPLVVIVTDANGNPIPNVPIQWTAEGGGSVSEASNLTDGNGLASVTRTLGPTAGPQTTRADAGQLDGSPIMFTHTATAGNAAGITKVEGDNQSGLPGAQLEKPLIVEVRDEQNNLIPNRDVTWVVGTGGGSVTPVNTKTNAEGQASTTWTLGPSVGRNTVNAVVSGVGTVEFVATADAGAVSSANSDVSAAPSSIAVGGQSTITVVVRDGNNNPVSGTSVSVNATGSGNTITPASASTGANGVATFTFSSTVAEMKTITATAGGVTLNDQPTITVQKTSSTVEIMDDEPDPSTVGEPISVEFRVRGSGGMPTGEVVVTISGGNETCRGTLTDGNGSCELTPTVAGTGTNNRRVITATYGGDAQFSGGTDTDNHRVNPEPAPNQPPTADFRTFCEDAEPTCFFTNDSRDPDDGVFTSSWNFGDPNSGAANTSTETHPSHEFSAPGVYTVTLTVRDSDGATATISKQVTVNGPPANNAPTASFTMTCDAATRTCSFAESSSDPDNDIVSWNWNFGDGSTFVGKDPPPHTYLAPGSFTVSLTVADDDSAQDTHEETTPAFP
jgi:PKD repeat protein